MRVIRSILFGLLLGAIVGLYFGWGQFPAESRNSNLSDLARPFRDDYIVMAAAGYAADGDLDGAIQRLSRLGIDDAPSAIREITERIILNSARGLADIRLLVNLADELGQLTQPMRPFLDASRGRE